MNRIAEDTSIDEIILESRKGNKSIQRIFYLYCEYLSKTVLYRYSYLLKQIGINWDDEQYVLNESVFKILQEDTEHYDNFPSYFRVCFEYVLRELIRKVTKKYKYCCNITSENRELIEDYYAFTNYSTTGDYVCNFIDKNEINYALNDSLRSSHPVGAEIVCMVGQGYSILEASKTFNLSYYKCKQAYDETINDLKKEFNS